MSKSSKVVSKKEKVAAKKPVEEVESEEEEVVAPKAQKNAKQNGAKGKKEETKSKKKQPEPEPESSEEEQEEQAEESPEADGEEAEEEEEVPVLNKRKASDQSVGDEKRQKTAAGGSTVFVGRVADTVDDDKIKEFFAECGTITAVRWNIDRETGNFKGCGWLDFETPEGAQKALEMAGAELEGKNINVDLATPRGDRPERGAPAAEGNTVFIKNFGTEADEESVVAAINTIAEPTSYRLAKDRESGAFRGFGHFDFADSETAQKIIEGLNGYEFQGNNLSAEISAPRTPGGGRGGRGGGFGGGRGGGFGGGRGGGFGGGRGGRGGGFGGGRGGGFGGGRGGGFGGGRGGRGGGFGGGRGGGRGRF